jgi:serine/threonine protein phosphatase 1
MTDTIYYAIGDVHGEAEKLKRLLSHIEADARARGSAGKVVFLGDIIDRGPDSRSVVELAFQLHKSGDAVALKGNHEELMLYAYDREDTIGLYHWANNGGDDTIRSYQNVHGRKDHWREAVDRDHIVWLRSLPTIWRDEARKLVFVHAGIDPNRFPHCPESVHMWSRSPRFYDPKRWPNRPELEGIVVVHGHTPTNDLRPFQNLRRINVDTGACFGGPLTCAVLAPGEAPRFLSAEAA